MVYIESCENCESIKFDLIGVYKYKESEAYSEIKELDYIPLIIYKNKDNYYLKRCCYYYFYKAPLLLGAYNIRDNYTFIKYFLENKYTNMKYTESYGNILVINENFNTNLLKRIENLENIIINTGEILYKLPLKDIKEFINYRDKKIIYDQILTNEESKKLQIEKKERGFHIDTCNICLEKLNINNTNACAICLENIDTILSKKTLECEHSFHKTCINMIKNHKCPLCQQISIRI
jgi:hypothetical protein